LNKINYARPIKHFSTIVSFLGQAYVKGLIKYMEVVREIARKKGNWWYYDHEFRSTKFQVQIGWQMTHQ
jgi:hypothetical protein